MPRIYVACLASYNAGTLHGKWIDVDAHSDVAEEIATMIKESPTQGAEEWAIHDHEGWLGLDPSAYCDNELPELARLLDEHGEAFAAWVKNGNAQSYDFDDYESGFQDAYAGEWDSLEDFANEILEDSGLRQVPEEWRRYFDFAAYGRDLELGGDIWRDGKHVFWNR